MRASGCNHYQHESPRQSSYVSERNICRFAESGQLARTLMLILNPQDYLFASRCNVSKFDTSFIIVYASLKMQNIERRHEMEGAKKIR
jgi:hypothetical protein